MATPFDILSLASVLSLEADRGGESEGERLVLARHGHRVALPASVVGVLETETPVGRHLAYGVLFGIRLAIDRSAARFDVSKERPETPARVFHHHEIPSVYGDRLPRLVPKLMLRWFEALSGEQAVTTPWHASGDGDEGLVFVYILETGKCLHVLCESDMARLPMTRERVLSDARHALFYDAYRLKARHTERTDQGRVRTFRTVEGLGASRAMLLPDFDYDAAREEGCFAIPSRDTLVIGRPEEKQFSEAIFERVCEATAELVESEAFPLSSMVYRMTVDQIAPAHLGDATFAGAHRLPLTDYDETVLPPEGVHLERLAQTKRPD